MAMPASFWKKTGPMIPPDQNPHQTVTFSGCIWSWCISRGLVSSQIRQFCSHIHSSKNSLIAKDDLFGEIWINFQLLQNAISKHTALFMVVYLKFLGQSNFIGVQTQIPTQKSPSWSRRKAKFLWMTRNWPPRVFYILTHSSDVFSRLCVSATYWCWLIIYRIWSSNSRLGRTVVARIKIT